MPIHPTAVVDPRARIHPSVEVGPLAVIDGDVELGEGCRVGAHVHLTGHTTIGARNVFGTGSVIGGPPQDLRFNGAPTRLRIGDDNLFREHVTVHCSNKLEEDTVLGSRNTLMAHCHVGHNCQLGDHIIIANGALLGGHVLVQDRAFISGNCLVHQFSRVGTLALMQGGSAISKDLPPYCISRGDNSICGLNVIGLRRAGLGSEVRLELRALYRTLFRSEAGWRSSISTAAEQVRSEWGQRLVDFVRSTKRGVLTGSRASAEESDDESGA